MTNEMDAIFAARLPEALAKHWAISDVTPPPDRRLLHEDLLAGFAAGAAKKKGGPLS